MDTSEIKARIASLLGLPLNDVVLRQRDDVTANFSVQNNKFVIEYRDSKTLVHEFLHACFSPTKIPVNKTLNALEDYRLSIKSETYDKELARHNAELYNEIEIKNLLRKVDGEEADKIKGLLLTSIPIQSSIDVKKLLETNTTLPKDTVGKILDARKELLKDPSKSNLIKQAYELDKHLHLEQDSPAPNPTVFSCGDGEEGGSQTKQDIEQQAKRSLHKKEVERLTAREEVVLIKALNNILRNKAIGKKQNTIKGKLKTKRLGHYPSHFLFEKKDKPKPETALYILADISGSMLHSTRLPIVIKFLNSIRLNPVKNLELKIRCFNGMYFKDSKIPYYYDDFIEKLMSPIMPSGTLYNNSYSGYNDDAHWLKETLKEINSDPTPNKALLILSDGDPAPCGLYEEKDLEAISKVMLPKSKIPYMSIGLDSDSVENYYLKSKVAVGGTELVNLLLKYSRELVR